MKLFSYDDICLRPKHSSLKSRNDGDTSINFCGYNFKLPVIPANMQDVISWELSDQLSSNEYCYIMHRFKDANTNIPENIASNIKFFNISIGIKEEDKKILKNLNRLPNFITIDIAHADHENIRPMISFIQREFPTTKIIAGNVATVEGYEFLCNLGVDAVKVGIGGGCFIPNSQVKTDVGNKNIQDVDIGDKVLTHTGEYKSVTNKFSFDRNEDLIKINESITCTKNHEFYVIHKKDVDKINDSNIKDYAVWIEAKNLTNEYFLIEMG